MENPGLIPRLLEEYQLEIDDVRWYASIQACTELQEFLGEPKALIRHIWSGTLEERLYRMEERFLETLAAEFRQGIKDEAHIRGTMLEIQAARRRRSRQ